MTSTEAEAAPETFAEAEAVLATALPNYETRSAQQSLAQAIETVFAKPEHFAAYTGSEEDYPDWERPGLSHLLGQAGCGCIQADAEIIVNRGGNGTRMTLKALVDRFNGMPGRYQWDISIPTYVQREAEDGTVRLARLRKAWFSGEQTTFTVTTDTGRTIRATDKHPFLTERGWLRLDELEMGDEVHVRGEQASGRPRQPKIQYSRIFRMQAHPYANRFKNNSAMVPQHRLVAEAERNNLAYEVFRDKVIAGDVSGLEFLDPEVWAVHHRDHDSMNNDLANLQVMTHAEHHRLHAEEGKTLSVLYKVATEKVVSVEEYGVEDTYDLEVEGEPHNFLANGFVVHNTGKSLAYLIPALLSGRRVIVSVTTKALQDQLVSTDLPFLSEHLGIDFRWALLKGRGNYLCMSRLGVANENDAPAEVLRAVWEATQAPGFTGLREEIGIDVPDKVWSLIASESEDCSSNKCKPEECYAERARDVASRANVVIANHALFFTDLKIKTYGLPGMLNEYDLVIFDEAHSLEEVAGNVLGGTLSEGTFASFTSKVRNWGHESADDEGDSLIEPITKVTVAAKGLFSVLQPGRLRTGRLNELVEEFGEIYDAVDSTLAALKKSSYDRAKDPTRASKRRWALIRQCYGLLDRMGEIIAAPADEVVRWVEAERRRTGETVMVIKTAPILVAPFLRKWLYSKTPTVLVSATLAVKGKMSYIAGRLGIDTYASLDVGTPFDFSTQGRLYIPVTVNGSGSFPAPAGQNVAEWQAMATHEIHRLVTMSRGRALVLFTSIKHMKETEIALKQMPGDLAYRMQGERGVTNRDLVDWLKDHSTGGPGRVLLATKSFFTGIDIPGDALSMLIITKMPFPVPTEPLTEARCEAIEMAGGSSFADYTIPVMSLELQQGVGRLIRHRNDRGVAAILDPRLVNKSYGKAILRDLPPMPQTFSLGEVGDFFSSLEEVHA